ncbi:MAG: DUF92 domain-containing protein [Chloroflexi bacterium]|nr:DUF92 domain-containing protein [Chloroflexota bacterium]
MISQIIIGILLSLIISLAAWRFKSLSRSGAFAALIMGCLIFGLGGLPWAALLLTFFISSSVISRYSITQKKSLLEKFSKGSQRDWGQVLANGGLGAIFVIFHTITPQANWHWAAFIGAMAAVNADTWATELGVFSRSSPRLITNGKRVERGASGGITLFGYLAALAGALLVVIVAIPFSAIIPVAAILAIGIIGGIAGTTLDSWLGATLQAIYFCPACKKETERHPLHTCGEKTHLSRGLNWMNNDWVNFFCSAAGALSAYLVYLIIL